MYLKRELWSYLSLIRYLFVAAGLRPLTLHMSDLSIKSHNKLDEEKLSRLKLDSHGLPLIPQPSDDPADPLNWPLKLKVCVEPCVLASHTNCDPTRYLFLFKFLFSLLLEP